MRSRLARILALLVAGACAAQGGDARMVAVGVVAVLVVSEVLGVVAELPNM
jgi:hypothetical protein